MSPHELEQKMDVLLKACEVAGIGTWEWDFASNRVRWNRAMAKLLNADENRLELSGAQSLVGVLAEDLPEIHERVGVAIRDRTDYTMQLRIGCEDGSTRCLHSHGKALYDTDGKASTLVGVTFDGPDAQATEQECEAIAAQAAREAAEQATRMTDEFLATLSHELRTPLNAVLGWAQILRLKTKDSADDIKRGLEAIERNARLQTQLIDDMLDMSRVIAGKVRLETQLMHPRESIEAAIETIQPIANAKSVTIEKMLLPQSSPISADPGRLQQIIWNLLSNAVKFTPAGGTVRVVLTSTHDRAVIEVIDTGIGMTADLIEHVFERLPQDNAANGRSHSGLGLGLVIVKQLVDLHGGSVQASSPGPQMGTTMAVSLPLQH